MQSVDVGNDAVLALRHGAPPSATLTLANLSDRAVEIALADELSGPGIVEVVNDADYDPPCRGRVMLGAYGFRWLRQVAAP